MNWRPLRPEAKSGSYRIVLGKIAADLLGKQSPRVRSVMAVL
jgi:hypothetical protein